jgi:uncharacterized protein YutE (UPF0331/DUF86 family)
MAALDRELLAEKAAAIERHLDRVAARLPPSSSDLVPSTDASDSVILHLWQAVQLTIDLAVTACLHLKLGTPEDYGDAFRRLSEAGSLEPELARRLVRAAGFRNQIAHAYEKLEMDRVYAAATEGPADLRAFLAALKDRIGPSAGHEDSGRAAKAPL